MQLLTTDSEANKDSQVQVITGTENERDLQARQGIKMLSERESLEMRKNGDVLR